MRAFVIVDLGFGDAGKGLLTDFLVRHLEAPLVVRYNGGAQAGHNVVTSAGIHHTFAQFGAGTFKPAVRTFLSRHVLVHPTALLAEGDILVAKGVIDAFDRLAISNRALVITPFHQAANRIRELARAGARHGSCGVGIGETVSLDLARPDESVRTGDLAHPSLLRAKLEVIRQNLREQLVDHYHAAPPGSPLEEEGRLFERPEVIDLWMESISRFSQLDLVTPDSTLQQWLHEANNVVFEGAQGVLLDADAGFHPHTTWSRCTTTNALDLLAELAPASQVSTLGLLRTYAIRHGPGPFPTETTRLTPLISEHNRRNDWQGVVRYGWFDAPLVRYALQVNGRVDVLALTHLDLLPRLPSWTCCPAYQPPPGESEFFPTASDRLDNIPFIPGLSLEERTRLTGELSTLVPVLETCPPHEDAVLSAVESLLGQPVDVISRGPTAAAVQFLRPLPW